ncbi:unnamed protein product [Spirodela intermedia]|uniref:WRKY domain-containing protein n=1 Tax=Spirodela intermedia TaxID=51605 RepID=A0A7I8IJG4_SPIIN|nr:unnamed protein product [Spirodela intermedia]CAA6657978.1 unnamed protein product [Spirodela intermedia]
MCSCFWQKMDADHGDLGDVVRRGAGGGCGVPPRAGQHVPELAGFPPPERSNDDFGDPFSSFRDPLLHDLGGGRPSLAAQMRCRCLARRQWWVVVATSLGFCRSHPLPRQLHPRKSQTKKVVCIPAPPASSSRPGGDVIPLTCGRGESMGRNPLRGYYRCSSSKGCSARKQVERSRSDPNMLVITYTSEHNHPWPTQKNSLAGSTRSQPVRSGAAAMRVGSSSNQRPAVGEAAAAATAAEGLFAGLREMGIAGEEREGPRTGATADRFAMFDWGGNPFGETKNWGL